MNAIPKKAKLVKVRAVPLLPSWAIRPVVSWLLACRTACLTVTPASLAGFSPFSVAKWFRP
eukprot:3520453-Amphidinium_carterae.3